MTLGTIISHLEKLKAKNMSLDLSSYKPKEKDFKAMSEAFKSLGKQKFLPSTEYWTAVILMKNCVWLGCFCDWKKHCFKKQMAIY